MRELATTEASWTGGELLARDDFQHRLDDAEIAELRAAAERIVADNLDLDDLEPAAVPLPTLARRLTRIQDSLEHGSGAALLQGWPAADHDLATNRRVHWLISRHVGTPVSQSATGERIFHVENKGYAPTDPRDRGPSSSRELRFHSDRCDVLSFLCVRPALSGGDSFLVSTPTIHDAIRARRPDLLEELYGLWYSKRHTVDPANPQPWCQQPIFARVDDRFVAYLLRVLIDRAYAMPELPDLRPSQRQALDLIDDLCADPTFHVRFRQEAGDILFANNFTTLHSRSEFVDAPEPERRRLILRIWLSVPNSRRLPDALACTFGATEAGALRGGIHPPAAG
ncbi:MAG: TauD/TfdA family dioxygenase [Acidobacteriota bacterium]